MSPDGSLAIRAGSLLQAQGISSARLISVEATGDGLAESATFELDGLLLRFVRERAEEFLDIGTPSYPHEFHQFDDVKIALGWASADAILAKRVSEPLDDVIKRLAQGWAVIRTELAGPHAELTRARILKANAARARAVEARLRS